MTTPTTTSNANNHMLHYNHDYFDQQCLQTYSANMTYNANGHS